MTTSTIEGRTTGQDSTRSSSSGPPRACSRCAPGRSETRSRSGPTFPGEEIYSTCIDNRGPQTRVFVGSVSNHWGPVLRRSDDLAATWREEDHAALAFPDDIDASLARVWQLTPGPADQPDVFYAGVEPAALFRSDDGARTFSLMRGLWDHPHRPKWVPGGGGMCLHTILVHPTDPQRLLIAVSAAGVYRSDDGGETWSASNRGIVVPFMPDAPAPEFGQCVHKVARDPDDPDRLYLQHHGGIYTSDNGGDSWEPMTSIAGMDFGFRWSLLGRRLPSWVAVAVAVRLASTMKRLTLALLLASAVMTELESRVRFCSVVESLPSRLSRLSVCVSAGTAR